MKNITDTFVAPGAKYDLHSASTDGKTAVFWATYIATHPRGFRGFGLKLRAPPPIFLTCWLPSHRRFLVYSYELDRQLPLRLRNLLQRRGEGHQDGQDLERRSCFQAVWPLRTRGPDRMF